MTTENLVIEITNYLNSYNNKSAEFNKAMSKEHRTLQQSFTRLCLSWLEHCASDEYRTDGRNEQSKEMAKTLLNGFKDYVAKNGYTDETLEFMSIPSKYLTLI